MTSLKATRPLALLASALLVSGLVGCASNGGDDESSESADGLATPGTLVQCSEAQYPPFESKEGDKIVGIDADISQAIADDLGATLQQRDTPFEGLQSGASLNSKQCDIAISAITINDERKTKMDFSDPYFTDDLQVITRNDATYQSTDDLKATQVAKCQQDALLDQAAPSAEHLAKYPDKLKVAFTIPTGEQYGIAVRKGNTELLDKVNATLKRLDESGELDQIKAKWIKTSDSSASPSAPAAS